MKKNYKSFRFRNEHFIYLLPIFFVLHGYVEYFESIPNAEVILLCLKYILASFLLSLAILLLLKDTRKALVFAFALMAFHLMFGSMHDWLKANLGAAFITQYKFLLPFFFSSFMAAFFLLKRTNKNFNRLTSYLNLLFALFILIDLVRFGMIRKDLKQLPEGFTICQNCTKPDIYLLVADGYGGYSQLKHHFNFDNSSFENFLRGKGFYIVDSSISNYSATIVSMASLFNMTYMHSDSRHSHEIISKANFFKFLSAHGYDIKNNSFFNIWGQFPATPINYFPVGIHLITNNTFLSRLEIDLKASLVHKFNIKAELKRIHKIEKEQEQVNLIRDSITMSNLVAELNRQAHKPKFVYTHFIMPHAPYIYNELGKINATTLSDEEKYIAYLKYTTIRRFNMQLNKFKVSRQRLQ